MNSAVIIAMISLVSTVIGGVLLFLGQRQSTRATQATAASTMAREEIEQALSSQGARINALTARAELAEARAEQFELHARSCDLKLAELQGKYDVLVNQLKGPNNW